MGRFGAGNGQFVVVVAGFGGVGRHVWSGQKAVLVAMTGFAWVGGQVWSRDWADWGGSG